MNAIIMFADQLFDRWNQQTSITRDVKNIGKVSDLSNAKAEQILDDLYVLYECVKSDAPEVADHIYLAVKNKLKLLTIAEAMFAKHIA
jgi:hypothetical protein